ncbi:hypothetical protein ZIOFF_026113 [Zingiber officinale]|uniref:Uncharacterized protein n=1 Tax=Zingiber officinale TaxID=94328 RepID=A0A8J5H4I2_ZINOF|nr:hypothetical protein ZIOFF_026113 [Zingiber officinale]
MSESKRRVLLLTDNVFIPVNAVLASAIDSSLGLDLSARDDVFVKVAPSFRSLLGLTSFLAARQLGGKLPIESGSLDVTVSVSKSLELVDEEWSGNKPAKKREVKVTRLQQSLITKHLIQEMFRVIELLGHVFF